MSYSIPEKLQSLWTIIRPVNDFVMGIGLNVGMILAGSYELGLPFIFYIYALGAGFFLSAHAMVVNDIIDIEIDLINEPNRVLPKGIISRKTAAIYSIFLGILGVLFFALIDIAGFDKFPYLWLYGLAHLVIADLYNYKLKEMGFIGNLTVAWTGYALFFGADIFLNGHLTLIPQVIGVIAFCADLSREIYKGIIDQEGDREHNVKTIAVVLGPRKAKYIASAIFSVCILVSVYAFPQLLLLGKIGLLITNLLFVYILWLAKDAEDPQQTRKIKTYIMMGPLLVSPFLILDRILQISFTGIISN